MPSAAPLDRPASADRPDWLRRGFILAAILACAVALSPSNVDPDLWGHVQYGEDLLADGVLPETATHTFTAEGHRWINHENLSELAFALGYRHLGPRGLLWAKCLLGLGVMVLMVWVGGRRGVELPVMCGVMLLVATTLTAFWPVRPQLFSYVFFAIMIALVSRVFAEWSGRYDVQTRWLWLAAPLFAVWANTHGAFVAGYCIFIAYLGLRAIEALWHRGRAAWPVVGRLTLVALGCGAATLLNPYGPELLVWLAQSLAEPRPEITEWAPPRPSDEFFYPFVLLAVLTVVAWTATRQKRDWVPIVLIVLTFSQAAMHLRHIAFFAVLCGFWLPEHVQSIMTRLRGGATDGNSSRGASTEADAGAMPRVVFGGLLLAFVLLGFKLTDRLGDFPVERSEYPVDAIAYMAEHRIDGRLVVAFNWAQYAVAALAPDVRVAFDGRFRTCYPQEVVDMHFDFLMGDVPGYRNRSPKSGEVDGTRVLSYGEPDLALVDRRYPHSVAIMREQDDWTLLYQDGLAQLWGRRERFDRRESPDYLAVEARQIDDRPISVSALELEGSVTWPALPPARGAEGEFSALPDAVTIQTTSQTSTQSSTSRDRS